MSVFMSLKVVHVFSASLWIGGILLTVVINRGLRRTLPPMEATRMLGDIGRFIQKPMRAALYTAIATGPALLLLKGIGPEQLLAPSSYSTQLGGLLLGKLASVLAILALLPHHSRLGSAVYKARDRKSYSALRRRILVVGWATLASSLLALLFGTGLRLA